MSKRKYLAAGIVILMLLVMIGFAAGSIHHKNKTTFSVLGDSISTYDGMSPKEYYAYYPVDAAEDGNDLLGIADMWFSIFSKKTGAKLIKTNSAAGSMIVKGEDNPGKPSISERTDDLGHPDIIFVFGGINDYWEGIDLKEEFIPSFGRLLDSLQDKYPESKVVYLAYSELPADWKNVIGDICEMHEVQMIELPEVPMINSHPTRLGMLEIGEYVAEKLIDE